MDLETKGLVQKALLNKVMSQKGGNWLNKAEGNEMVGKEKIFRKRNREGSYTAKKISKKPQRNTGTDSLV